MIDSFCRYNNWFERWQKSSNCSAAIFWPSRQATRICFRLWTKADPVVRWGWRGILQGFTAINCSITSVCCSWWPVVREHVGAARDRTGRACWPAALLRPYQGICAPAQQKKRGLGAGGGSGSSETPKNGVSEEPKLHGKHADCTQGWVLSMITVVIDHISWHEAQQEHTDNHNLNGGGCHYQSGFRLVMDPWEWHEELFEIWHGTGQ